LNDDQLLFSRSRSGLKRMEAIGRATDRSDKNYVVMVV